MFAGMHRPLLALSLLALLSSCGGAAVQTAHEAASTGPTLEGVAWVIGSWEGAVDEHGCTSHEEWRRESETLFTGHARDV